MAASSSNNTCCIENQLHVAKHGGRFYFGCPMSGSLICDMGIWTLDCHCHVNRTGYVVFEVGSNLTVRILLSSISSAELVREGGARTSPMMEKTTKKSKK